LANGTKVEILEQQTVGTTVWGRISAGWICMDYVVQDGTDPDPDIPYPYIPPVISTTYPKYDFSQSKVPDSWFDNVLIIGDSRTVGMRDSARLGNADYFCSNGANLSTILTTACKDKNFESQLLAELLVTKKYDKIIINLGVNDCGIAHSAVMERYNTLLSLIRHHQPDATIILQGILMVTQSFLDGTSSYSPATVASLNNRIKALADGESIYYIESNPYFTGSTGYLYDDLTWDGIHLKDYKPWADWLSYAVGQLGI